MNEEKIVLNVSSPLTSHLCVVVGTSTFRYGRKGSKRDEDVSPKNATLFFPLSSNNSFSVLVGVDIGVGGELRPSVGTALDVTLRREYPATYSIKHERGEPYDCGEGAETIFYASCLLTN